MSEDIAEIAAGKSLLERAPADLSIQWRGGLKERWTIALSCTIVGADEAEALREIIRVLSEASDARENGGAK